MTSKSERTRERLLTTALECFAQKGFAETTMRDIARAADCSTGLAYRYFKSKEHFVQALYLRLAEDLVAHASSLDQGRLADRVVALLRAKVGLISAHREVLLALFSKALDPAHPLGALSPETAEVRARVSDAFRLAIEGAEDVPADPERAVRLVYGLHLLVVLLWTQDRSEGQSATLPAVDLIGEGLVLAQGLSSFPGANRLAKKLDAVAAAFLEGA